jgi:predicted ribosome quality control (RQC) complex YloA/Tae2 family protein
MKEYPYYHKLSKKNYNIKIGSNAKDNWKLLDDADINDIWFHLESYPSSHIFLERTDKLEKPESLNEIPADVITICAKYCKINSKTDVIGKLRIIYTKVKNIKKGKNIGSVYASHTKVVSI